MTATTRTTSVIAFLLAGGLTVAGCGGPPERQSPVGPVVSPRPVAVDWANSLCTTLNPVFEAMNNPPGGDPATARAALLDRVTTAQTAVQRAESELTAVGPAPAENGMTIIDRIHDRLDRLGADLGAAATALTTADASDPAAVGGAVQNARGALASFDRAGLRPLLDPDPALQNALDYAPTCTG